MTSSAAATSAKAALRKQVHDRRDALPASERETASARIAERVMAIVARERPRVLAAYLPVRSECDCRSVIEAARGLSIAIVLPSVADATTMVFRRHEPGDALAAGGFGTLAPPPGQPILDPDMALVPLVGFDRTGARLGHGRGFYDRAMAALAARGIAPKLVGVGFAVQEVASIPVEPHDAPLDWMVTEKETLDLRRQA